MFSLQLLYCLKLITLLLILFLPFFHVIENFLNVLLKFTPPQILHRIHLMSESRHSHGNYEEILTVNNKQIFVVCGLIVV